ncbi:MAG: HEAT repeat domain-containing protein [Gemmatimonadales bacterium]
MNTQGEGTRDQGPRHRWPLAAITAIALAASLHSQGTLRSRVEASDGRVQFRFAPRADVCGWGPNVQVGRSTFISSGNFATDDRACRRGPVVVRVTRSGGQVVGVETEIAPDVRPEGVTDLGAVSAPAAAEYLLDLAGRAEGRPAREAILPAVLADSAMVWPALLALGRNRDLSRSVRQSALGWLGREIDRLSAEDGRRISAALVTLAGDSEETTAIRQQAVSVLARNQRADLAALTRMAGGEDLWLRKAAIQALASSGDPRARDFLRTALNDPNLSDQLRVSVIRGLGGQYATARDLELLRTRYRGLSSSDTRRAVLSAVAEQGGPANLQWLLGIAGDPDTEPEVRSQATEAVQRAGGTTAQLVRLYEQSPDRRGKEAAINALFRNGDRAAVDALVRMARTETDISVRKSLINRLGRLDDERVRELLREMTGIRN